MLRKATHPVCWISSFYAVAEAMPERGVTHLRSPEVFPSEDTRRTVSTLLMNHSFL